MRNLLKPLIPIALLMAPIPALAAGAGSFTLVNGTGSAISSLSIRRHGTDAWKPIGGSPAAGASAAISFSDPDCAFDIRATLAGGASAIWSGVNLCEVKSVTLNRSGGRAWVDYD
jgi:hypothetical protein